MIDRRFWSGAILVTTVVVAGAGSLPALLLRPAAPDPAPAAPVPIAKIAEPAPLRVEAPPAVKAEPWPAAPAPGQQLSAAEPVPPPQPVAAPSPVAFPPVQPVGIAESAAPARPVATPPPARAERRAARLAVKRKRSVRPTLFPIREFFAWRR